MQIGGGILAEVFICIMDLMAVLICRFLLQEDFMRTWRQAVPLSVFTDNLLATLNTL